MSNNLLQVIKVKLDWMKGLSCTNINSYDPHHWHFEFGDECQIDVDTSWRLISADRISLTRDDHGKRWGDSEPIDALQEAIKFIKGASINMSGYSDTGDLIIDFEGPNILQIIVLPSLYEGWNLKGPNGRNYIAMGGGEVAVFLPE